MIVLPWPDVVDPCQQRAVMVVAEEVGQPRAVGVQQTSCAYAAVAAPEKPAQRAVVSREAALGIIEES